MKYSTTLEAVDNIITTAKEKGIIHLYTDDDAVRGSNFSIDAKTICNFGSCSYLGLEFDYRLIDGAKQALDRYGTQFSASRAYISTGSYATLENRFEHIFESPCVIVPTTTLGHISTIPVLIEDDDVVILDHQVHGTVQNAVQLLKPRGVKVDIIRHNRMDILEERIQQYREKYKRIWYMADGIYSMYGDKVPMTDIQRLLDTYPEFHFYVDDAHGMSCYGKHGRGYVLGECDIHERMIVATSLAKAFATGGAVFVFPNEEWAHKVRNCGGPMLSSGPMQPSSIGAAIACADIHLSEEIEQLKEDLQQKIKYTSILLKKHGLPVISDNDTPIFFVGVGLPKMGYNIIKRLLDDGIYTNIGIFPTVPMKNTGIRFTITNLNTFEQIEELVEKIAYHFPLALEEEGFSMEQIYKAFKIPTADQVNQERISTLALNADLSIHHLNSIDAINKREWDMLFAGKGSFDWEGVKLLEKTFSDNPEKENNWDFDYLMIKDAYDKPVLATFMTTIINKDDMFAPANISRQIEVERRNDPYYLTSKVLSLGSMLTLGEHLYVDYDSKYWKEAIDLLISRIYKIQDKHGASGIMLRDFTRINSKLDEIFNENGFLKVGLSQTNIIDNLNWNTLEEYLSGLTPSSKKHVKRYILKNEPFFDTRIVKHASDEQVDKYYELYMNVKGKSTEVNTFDMPKSVFHNIVKSKNWEVLELRIKETGQLVGMAINNISGKAYNFLLAGIDYAYQQEYKPYKQLLYQVVKRANALNMKVLNMGITTDLEKKKVGAKQIPIFAYMQLKDHYNASVIQEMSINKIEIEK